MCNLSSKHPRRLKLTSKLMSIKLKEILTKNGPYPTPLNPISSQAKADPGLAPAMFFSKILRQIPKFSDLEPS